MKTIQVKGRCTLDTTGEFKTLILESLSKNVETLVVDVAGLTEIDTAGVQLFVAGLKEADRRGISVEFSGPLDPNVAEAFDLSGVHYGAQ